MNTTILSSITSTSSFACLFKKYRLKAEFATLSDFGEKLSEKGFRYEESVFSHWQKGNRIPHNRIVLLKILVIFIERKAISTIEEANVFLSTTGQGYLSDKEIAELPIMGSAKKIYLKAEQTITLSFTDQKTLILSVK